MTNGVNLPPGLTVNILDIENLCMQKVKWVWVGKPYHMSVVEIYRQVSNIRRTLIGNEIVDKSDVVGASPVGAAPTTSSLST